MPLVYSTYEAKARFSEVLRKVRDGRRVVITHHGQAIAEIGPIEQDALPLAHRLKQLEDRGVVASPATGVRGRLGPLARRRGALRRFLESRE